jgi:hypothetical protein
MYNPLICILYIAFRTRENNPMVGREGIITWEIIVRILRKE